MAKEGEGERNTHNSADDDDDEKLIHQNGHGNC
jgi:hypothetical protein